MLTRVLIDIGHGGKDPGAVYLTDDEKLIAEFDVCLEVGTAAASLLAKAVGAENVRVIDPEGLPIPKVAQKIDELADAQTLVVSLHMNKASPEATGTECFHIQGDPQAGIRAIDLLAAYCAHTGLKNRGPKPDTAAHEGSLGIMRMPKKTPKENILLLEMGFVSNEADVATVLLKGAEGLVRGILKVMGREFPANLAAPTLFPDVAKDHFAREAVESLHKMGIVKGYEDGTLRPDQPITRGEAFVLVDRALRLHGV